MLPVTDCTTKTKIRFYHSKLNCKFLWCDHLLLLIVSSLPYESLYPQ